MKVLFIHNTISEYRIPFFIGLSNKINVDYLITRPNLGMKIYGNEIDENEIKNLNIDYLNSGIRRYLNLFRIVKRREYDFIVLPPLDSCIDLIDACIALFISKIKKRKILYFGEKWESPKRKQPLLKRIKNLIQKYAFKLVLRDIDMCIVSGTKSKKYFEECGLKSSKISIAIDASGVNKKLISCNIREKYNIPHNAIVILYYGRIIKRKGLDLLIKAIHNNNNNNIYLLVCGDGPFKDECEKIVNKFNVKNILWEGYVNPRDKYTFFSQCDIFVLPSYFYKGIPEAWGLTVNEALQCGKPVITTNAVGSSFDLINDRNGIVVEENSIQELSYAINELTSNYKFKEMKNECKKVYKSYDYENMINSFILAINKIFI